jgi:RNA polymerase sigma-70 factor (ECF subfamily)
MATSTFPISLLDSTRIPVLGSRLPQLQIKGRLADTVARAQAGDQDAFKELYMQHKKHVFAVCIRIVRDFSLAEDLTQETFLQVHRKLSSFRGDSIFSTWLHRLAVNTALMHLRKRILTVVSLDHLMENIPEERAGRSFGTRDLTQAGVVDRLAIDRAVASMAPGYRSVFLLHDIHGFDHGEIASMLKCSCGNTKSQLHKARRVLRNSLSAPAPSNATGPVDAGRDACLPEPRTTSPRRSATRPLRVPGLRPQSAVSALAT